MESDYRIGSPQPLRERALLQGWLPKPSSSSNSLLLSRGPLLILVGITTITRNIHKRGQGKRVLPMASCRGYEQLELSTQSKALSRAVPWGACQRYFNKTVLPTRVLPPFILRCCQRLDLSLSLSLSVFVVKCKERKSSDSAACASGCDWWSRFWLPSIVSIKSEKENRTQRRVKPRRSRVLSSYLLLNWFMSFFLS